jgi:DNA-binding transcriptional LysR family regulator
VPVPEDRRRPTFRLLVVPGITVDRWSRTWSERLPDVDLQLVPDEAAAPSLAQVDAGLVRLPVDRDTFHAIPLYTEVTVVVVPRDHALAAAEEVTVADLADEVLLRPLDDVLAWPDEPAASAESAESPADRPARADRPATTAAAVELVAAGAGVLVVPQSLARMHHRRDLTSRTVVDAPTSSVALVWPRDGHTDLVEEMIGIVRGRTVNSTRGRAPAPATPRQTPRPSPRQTPRRRGR